MNFNSINRILQPELMDDLSLPIKDLELALKGLQRLNALSFSAFFTARKIYNLLLNNKKYLNNRSTPIRIMDIGSGGGEILNYIISFLRKRGFSYVKGIGVDLNPHSVESSNINAKDKKIPIEFINDNAINAVETFDYEILTSSLFLHHLSDDEVESIFRSHKASLGIVMSDLERTFIGYLLARIASKCFSRSPIVHADAPQSVQAAFTRTELLHITKKYLPGVKIHRTFPCRLMISWEASV